MLRSLSRLATPPSSSLVGSAQAGTRPLSIRSTLIPTLTGIVRRRQPTLTVASRNLSTTTNTNTTRTLLASSPSALLSPLHEETNTHPWWWYFAAGATATAMASSMGGKDSITLCDNHHNDDDDGDDDEKHEDPYDNLPEQDEPTHCSICLTYRQGPCRPYWRKVEACTKDHELKKKPEDENGDNADENNKTSTATKEGEDEEQLEEPPCLKYMLPWIDCATGYRNLYALIELDTNYTMGIAELENEATVQVCWAPSHEPTVDWTAWQEYVATHPHWKLPKRSTTSKKSNQTSPDANDHHVSLWKTLSTDRDPEMVEIFASVPSQQGQGILECAYAVDQDGNVLGFSYGTKPSEVAAKSSSDDKTGDEESTNTPVELKIRLLPLYTRSITISAAYTQPAKEGAKENDPLESHIFKTRSFSLKKMSKQQ